MGNSARDPDCLARCPQASPRAPHSSCEGPPAPRATLYSEITLTVTLPAAGGARDAFLLFCHAQCSPGPPRKTRPQILPPLALLGGQETKAARNELPGEGPVKAQPTSIRFSHFWAKSPVEMGNMACKRVPSPELSCSITLAPIYERSLISTQAVQMVILKHAHAYLVLPIAGRRNHLFSLKMSFVCFSTREGCAGAPSLWKVPHLK